jgi:hypothetical protein
MTEFRRSFPQTNTVIPSNLPVRHKLSQYRVDTGLPSGAAAPQMLDGVGVEPDFDLHLGRFQLGASAPGGLHSGHKGRIEWRIIIVDIWVKLVHN